MNKWQKWSSVAATAVMGVGLLAGCGSQSTSTSNTANGTQNLGTASNPVNLTVGIASSGPAETTLVNNQVKLFEKQYPNIHVTVKPFSGNELQDLQAELAAHTAPDIFYVDSSIAQQLEQSGAIAPLDSYMKQDNFPTSNYEASLMKAFQWQGKQYGIPKDENSLALESNMTLLNKAGITSPPKTWGEFETDAAKLKAKGIAPLAFPIDVARYYPFILNFGGSYYDATSNKVTFTNPANNAGLNFFLQNEQKGYLVNPSNLGGSWAGVPFAQGKVAMAAEGAWLIPSMQQTAPNMKYTITDFPTQNGKANNMVYTVAYEMAASSKNPAAAAKLLFFLTGAQAEKMTAQSGLAIPSYIPDQSVFLKSNPSYQAFVDGVKNGTAYQFGPSGNNFVNAINAATQAGVLKKLSPSAVLSQAQSTFQSQSQQ
ncbi:ABC transporter substrate-binding protein [Alicyclobacillus ferrooxydans]|uniref:ABC transporter substrate-binding protein n=1 Tax=Alicyclobacillus ferrooxydans TaxID=471514 RepID=A0A0P9CLZ6_9BACL|nr:extracellular solute-binding protein [Alicyclobacillus ferrooxydans]KPV44004.1 ABC transporter substrate-binding protein [Alicyclobacillus ferrooxydans]